MKRGCDTTKKILSGTSAASGLFGIKQTDYACSFQNGTLCNAQMANYDTSLQIKFQTVGMLRCMQCSTPEDNTDKDRDQLNTMPARSISVHESLIRRIHVILFQRVQKPNRMYVLIKHTLHVLPIK